MLPWAPNDLQMLLTHRGTVVSAETAKFAEKVWKKFDPMVSVATTRIDAYNEWRLSKVDNWAYSVRFLGQETKKCVYEPKIGLSSFDVR